MKLAVGILAVALVAVSVIGYLAIKNLQDDQAHARVVARDLVAITCQVAIDPDQALATEPNTSGKPTTPGTERAVFQAYVDGKAIGLSSLCEKARRVAANKD